MTSCSCYYVEVRDPEKMPSGLSIGETVTTNTVLYGSVEEFVDDSSVHYLYINTAHTYKKRYVLEQITIPAGTKFTVVGHKEPRHPFACGAVYILLEPSVQLSKNQAVASVSYQLLQDETLFVQRAEGVNKARQNRPAGWTR